MWSDFVSLWATPKRVTRVCDEHTLASYCHDFESFVRAVYAHTTAPGRVFVDGVKFISRVSSLAAGGVSIDGIIHLYRDPIDFVASSMRNTKKSGLLGLVEHSLRYRLYHRSASLLCNRVQHINVHYEQLALSIDTQLDRIFGFLEVEPMTLDRLREYMCRDWHFMGNSSLFQFDGVIRPSKHIVKPARSWAISVLAGRRNQMD